MKKLFYIILLFCNSNIYGQIITPSLKANFGVDGDLKANFFDTTVSSIGDDWFNFNNSTTGAQIIDTTGASAILARYVTDANFRQTSFSTAMSFPPFTILNNKLLLGAAFVRDYHGTDSTAFSGSKNGDSPGNWYSPPSTPVPNKNDILDVMAHMRRDGPGNTDSLWLFGGVSIEGTTGDRYFDFEMYQTDLSYDKTSGTFSGYGPDAGHTTWQFDAAGNITKPGDIIFSADYGNSTLSAIEARIWINKSSMSITPVGFNWSGSFDGATNGAQFGYAGIQPKTTGAFYTGIENNDSTWAGAFSLIRVNNSIVTNYIPGQFMEFSVNLSKLGLDPATMIGKNNCDMPFKRILVKSRSSTSFTSQLKDFVAPVNFFQALRVKAVSDVSSCGLSGAVTLRVSAPVQNSIYTWQTSNGHILTNPLNDSVLVDSAGTYIVSQQLQASCPAYATDTVVVAPLNRTCFVLEANITNFSGTVLNKKAELDWSVTNNNVIDYFKIESSYDGAHFSTLQKISSSSPELSALDYKFTDDLLENKSGNVYYRLKMVDNHNKVSFSKTIRLSVNENWKVSIFPNPVIDNMQISVYAPSNENVDLAIYDASGRLMRQMNTNISKGNSKINLAHFQNWPTGIYSVKVISGKNVFVDKFVIQK
ncbi:MAG: T9SS type A sorting domain-containing protein [Ginsengibacter sp.]